MSRIRLVRVWVEYGDWEEFDYASETHEWKTRIILAMRAGLKWDLAFVNA
jgi:hypothetical protein